MGTGLHFQPKGVAGCHFMLDVSLLNGGLKLIQESQS